MAVLWDKNTKPFLGWKDGTDVYATERGWVKSYPWGEVLEVAFPGLSADATQAGDPVGSGKAEVTDVKFTAADYSIGSTDTIDITVVFDEKVDFTGAPTIACASIASDFVLQGYKSTRQKNQLVFQATLAGGDTVGDDLVIGSAISLNGGTLTDNKDGQAADLTIANTTLTGVNIVA